MTRKAVEFLVGVRLASMADRTTEKMVELAARNVRAYMCVVLLAALATMSRSPSAVAEPLVNERIAGNNRYATVVAISQEMFVVADRVYLASGTHYADALSGGPSAALERAPLLLTDPSDLPDVVAEELARLNPSTVVVVGGEAAVSSTVASAAGRAAGGAAVERLGGGDRYETAALVSRVFRSADTVYIATGANFADALPGGAAAAALRVPLLLSAVDTLPAATAEALRDLDPASIVVLGGPAAVSDAVLNELASFAPATRVSGADRYATAVAIAERAFPSRPDNIAIASGIDFPDALAASMLTAQRGVPLMLTTRECLPSLVYAYADGAALTVVGGTGAIHESFTDRCPPFRPVTVREVPIGTEYWTAAYDLAASRQGGTWITLASSRHSPFDPDRSCGIIRVDAEGKTIEEIAVGEQPEQIVETPDGAVWYSGSGNRCNTSGADGPSLVRLSTAGNTTWPMRDKVLDLAVADDGRVWFVTHRDIGVVGIDGEPTYYDGGAAAGQSLGTMITVDANGTVWWIVDAHPLDLVRWRSPSGSTGTADPLVNPDEYSWQVTTMFTRAGEVWIAGLTGQHLQQGQDRAEDAHFFFSTVSRTGVTERFPLQIDDLYLSHVGAFAGPSGSIWANTGWYSGCETGRCVSQDRLLVLNDAGEYIVVSDRIYGGGVTIGDAVILIHSNRETLGLASLA